MPPTPRYLHEQGVIDLSNPTTWKVRVADENGKEIATMDSDEFSAHFANDQDLSKHIKRKDEPALVIPNKLDWRDIKLDGSVVPEKPLSEQDALLVLKAYLGI